MDVLGQYSAVLGQGRMRARSRGASWYRFAAVWGTWLMGSSDPRLLIEMEDVRMNVV